uniref:Uncharacterized protein n=2 Tax=Palpitomonas bilix TaxID=652834 RepID=A0A7S3LV80_9EUKA|mmetsp:Transcript_49401/g.127347  ORF Transcript_49401/g.127347 Transcript_49401/m.127347 type:complete len:636 (+) Transcript_49401:440-2347(+)
MDRKVATTIPAFRARVRSKVENPSPFGVVVSVEQVRVRQSISSPFFLDGTIKSVMVVTDNNVKTKFSRNDGIIFKGSINEEGDIGVEQQLRESSNSLLILPHSNTTFDIYVWFVVLDQGEAARVGQRCFVHNQCDMDVISIVGGSVPDMKMTTFSTALSISVSLPVVHFGDLEIHELVAKEVTTEENNATHLLFAASARMKWTAQVVTGFMPSLPFSIVVVKEDQEHGSIEVAYGWNSVMSFPTSSSHSDDSVADIHLQGVFNTDCENDISSTVKDYFEGRLLKIEAAILQPEDDICPLPIYPSLPAFAPILSSIRIRSRLMLNGTLTARLRSFDVQEGENRSLNVFASVDIFNPSIVNGTFKHAHISLFSSLSALSSSSAVSEFGVSEMHDFEVKRGQTSYDIVARILDTTSDSFSSLMSSYLNMQNTSFIAVVNQPSLLKGLIFNTSIPPLSSSLLSRLMLVFNAQSFLALFRGEGIISVCLQNPFSLDIRVKAIQFDVFLRGEKEVERTHLGNIQLPSIDKSRESEGGEVGWGQSTRSSLPLLLHGKTTTASTITYQLSMLSNLAAAIPPFLSVSKILPSCGSMCVNVDLEEGKLVLQPGTADQEIVVTFGCSSSSTFCSLPIQSSLESLIC